MILPKGCGHEVVTLSKARRFGGGRKDLGGGKGKGRSAAMDSERGNHFREKKQTRKKVCAIKRTRFDGVKDWNWGKGVWKGTP